MSVDLWIHGISSSDPKGSLGHLQDLGFSAVVLGADKDNIKASKELGLRTYVCTGTFSRAGDFKGEEYLSVDVEGKPREWFGSTCPNVDGVRKSNLAQIERALSETEADGLLLDGCRFASPASGLESFFTCFCHRCQAKATDLGYNFSRMKRHMTRVYRALADGRLAGRSVGVEASSLISTFSRLPGVADWLSFRRDCVLEHFSDVSDLVHGMGAKMGAYIFTPSLSPLVGQDYDGLAGLLDIASPMIYRNYPDDPGPACLNKETASLIRFLIRGGIPQEESVRAVNSFLGLREAERSLEDVDQGLTVESIELELKRSLDLLGRVPELAPILYLGDERVESSVKAAEDLGLQAVNFFVYKDEWQGTLERIAQRVD